MKMIFSMSETYRISPAKPPRRDVFQYRKPRKLPVHIYLSTVLFIISSSIILIASFSPALVRAPARAAFGALLRPAPALFSLKDIYAGPGDLTARSISARNALHDRYAVPMALTIPLGHREAQTLFRLLSSKEGRWGLFVCLEGSVSERTRAIATALTYAQNTDRVPVFYWRKSSEDGINSFSNVIRVAPELGAVFVDHYPDEGREQVDWASFSVLQIRQGEPQEDENRANWDLAKLRRENIDTFDGAAAVRAHIFVTLKGGISSQFVPVHQAANFLSSSAITGHGRHEAAVQEAYAFEFAISHVNDGEVERRLHDAYDVPYMLLGNGMRPKMQMNLLRSLVAMQATGVMRPRIIFIQAEFGLGNRMRALGSAIAFAKETSRVPVVIWKPDKHLNCRFSDLFIESDALAVIDSFEVTGEEWPWRKRRALDEKAQAMDWYNYMRQNGVHVNEPNDLVIDNKDAHIFVKSAYVIQSLATPHIMRTQSSFWKVLHSLTPNIAVARLVGRLDQTPVDKLMGVHIRSKRIDTDIEGVGVEDYNKESSHRTDYWRNLTQVDTFITEMKRQSPSQLFYVAADDANVLQQLQDIFPSRIYYTPRRCDGRDGECLPYALADILMLSKCKTIRGSYWSSFSELAVRIGGGGRVLLAGIDFGRPQKRRLEKSIEPVVQEQEQMIGNAVDSGPNENATALKSAVSAERPNHGGDVIVIQSSKEHMKENLVVKQKRRKRKTKKKI